ncbi:MAG: PspC domain-containing protein [Bacteroidales bacterium]|jgi:phage shock protein PspC (stress-responsive transcriptional regulator)|nr:PspC domain-containing protein [Bacteroidales bacterium]
MKKVVNVSLAGRSFTLEEDAYKRLTDYLEHYKARLTVTDSQKAEVMDEIEGRVAELFYQSVGTGDRVVSLALVEQVADALGMPDGSAETQRVYTEEATAEKKLFRDPDSKKLAGICSGLAIYLDVDVTLIRILMLLAIIFGTAGIWIYIIFWIAVPVADTPAKKCQMHGLAPTPANMSRFSTYSK